MTVALVSAGSAATGSTSVSPSWGQATAANHLLVAWVTSNNSGSSYAISQTAGSGWATLVQTGVAYNRLGVYYKLGSLGSDTAPAFSDSGATYMAASLAEFSGVDIGETGGVDTSADEPEADTVVTSRADLQGSDLLVAVFTWDGSNGSPSLGLTFYGSDGVNAITANVMSELNGSNPPFAIFGYGIGPSTLGSSADKAVAASSAFNNAPAGVLASFKPA